MRHALPIWYCLDYETQVKLAPLLDQPDNIPPCLWQEWPAKLRRSYTIMAGHTQPETWTATLYEIDKLMRQPPKHQKRVK